MDWNMFDNKGLKKRDVLLNVLIFKVLFTCKSTQTNTRWFCISIKNTSTIIKTIWNRIITWIKKNFGKSIEKIISNIFKKNELIIKNLPVAVDRHTPPLRPNQKRTQLE
jgi:hypothetical protein